jgi:replication factor C subunit 1
MKNKSAPPPLLGSKEIPVGQENCLEGLTFVFTGNLSSISREDASDLVKRYSGRVTSAPSRKTSYLVVGDEPSENKINKAKEIGIKVVNEDELFDLVRLRPGKASPEMALPVEKPLKKSQKTKDVEMVDTPIVANNNANKSNDANDELWTEKYRPKAIKDIIGNKTNVEKLTKYLKNFKTNLKVGFKGVSKDDAFRAVLISGPPGIGKVF